MWVLATLVGAALLCVTIFLRKARTRPYGRAAGVRTKTAAGGPQVPGIDALRKANGQTGDTDEPLDAPKEWWVNAEYFWVVLCKNTQFHRRLDGPHSHRIPLGHTDTIAPLPVAKPFKVRCDSCGKEYAYAPSEVMRWEMEIPESFGPHPLFRD